MLLPRCHDYLTIMFTTFTITVTTTITITTADIQNYLLALGTTTAIGQSFIFWVGKDISSTLGESPRFNFGEKSEQLIVRQRYVKDPAVRS
jgi:hypothetical protein